MANAVISRKVYREPAFLERKRINARMRLPIIRINKTIRVAILSGASQRPMVSVESGLLVELLSRAKEKASSKKVITTGIT